MRLRPFLTPIAVAAMWAPSLAFLSQDEAAPDAAVEQTIDFEKQILPIFKARCFECHGPDQQKGRLRFDERTGVFRGEDTTRWVVQPGDPEASEIYHRITLPADDFDVMPPEGGPLPDAEIALIRQWIAEGAVWPEGVGRSQHEPEDRRIVIPPMTDAQQAAEAAAIDALRDRGALVMRIAEETTALYVNASLLGSDFTDEDMALLDGLEPTLAWLNVSRTAITDAGLRNVDSFTQLRRLHLNNTAVTSDALTRLPALRHLRYLNLYDTAVDDAGVDRLRGVESLRTVYLWQTNVSEDAITRLRSALPDARIDAGNYTLAKAEPVAAEQPAAIAATCCETALAAGQLCVHACCVAAFEKNELCLKCNPDPKDGLLQQIQELAAKLKEADGDE